MAGDGSDGRCGRRYLGVNPRTGGASNKDRRQPAKWRMGGYARGRLDLDEGGVNRHVHGPESGGRVDGVAIGMVESGGGSVSRGEEWAVVFSIPSHQAP